MNMYNSVLSVSSDGTVNLRRELASTMQCSMDLRKFPHDIQHCQMSFLSMKHNPLEMEILPLVLCKFDSCDTVPEEMSSVFHILSINTSFTTLLEVRRVLHVDIIFQRQLQFYLCQVQSSRNMFYHGTPVGRSTDIE